MATLGETVGRTGWRVHAYVLMSNHYHLLVETPRPNLVRGMTWFQMTCTARYNARHHLSGHLFGGRYKALLVDPESEGYLVTLLNYIHLNPVRAGLVREGVNLLDYAWSSLPGYYHPRLRPVWLVVEDALGALQWRDTERDRDCFLDYMQRLASDESAHLEDPATPETLRSNLRSSLERGWYFGTKAFGKQLLEKANLAIGQRAKASQNYHGAEIHDHGEAEARRIIAQRLREAGLRELDLAALRKSDARKIRIAKEVRGRTCVRLSFVTRELSMGTPMNVSKLTNR